MAKNILNTLSGTIYDAYNEPMIKVTVQAYDKDLRTTQLLGKGKTDAKGFYTIAYDKMSYSGSENKTADVFIRVVDTDKASLGESPVHFNIPANFVLNFKIGNTPIRELDEFDALVQKIKPLTDPQKVAIADLQESDKYKDITFLANETGVDASRIALLPIAFTLSGKTKIAPDIFYGLFRLQYPTDLNALLLITSESIANGITTAISENIISGKWGPQVDSIVQTLNQLAPGIMLSGSDNQSTFFKQVIGAALPKPKQQQTFVSVYLANEKTPEKFWQALSKETGFTNPEVIAGIQSVLKLNLLTNNQPALTTLIYNEQQQNPALKDIRAFASFTKDNWSSRIEKLVSAGDLKNFPDGIEGNTPEEKTENYAKALTLLINSLYPVDVFANQLSKDTSSAFKETKSDLKTFFTNNVDYDLKSNRADTLFDEANLTGITNKESLKKELVTINRLSKITKDYSEVSTLRLDGINSATALINKYSPSQFAQKFAASMTPIAAETIYKNAQQIDNRSTALALSLKMRNDIPIYVINGPINDASPDYASTFGDTNCDCEHCQSVYSPSAYFVDILHIIKEYNLEAYEAITTRRPDLIQILLTCKNTNTPLPYIDLVNELLENTIAPPLPLQPYQTTNSAAELLAYPEHVNTVAYDLLKIANSAFNLPLDLPLEETRLYLDKLGVKRYGLMELFYGKNTGSKYNDLSIAAEYLQLSRDEELNLINGTTPKPVTLDMVTDFLADTGLTFIEMLQLLECHFINPSVDGERTIKIVSITEEDQTTCKIEDLKLQTVNPTSLKVNPFIRLWKKTGWDILDLDRAFVALGISDYTGDVNRNLIIPLSHISRLKEKYNQSVQNIVTLWSKIDTHIYFDHSVEGQPEIPTHFASLFQNKQVTNPVDPNFNDPFALSGTLAAKSGIIIAALNLSQNDFDALNQTPIVDGQLTMENLSVLFRYAMLAKVLKLSVNELINVIDLTAVNPFGNSLQTAGTLTFIDTNAFIRSSGFSLPLLISLLANDPTAIQQININDISKVFNTLREGLQKIELLESIGATPQEQANNKLQNQNSFITDMLGTAFKTEAKVINVLINSLVKSVADNTKSAIVPFIDAGFIESDGPLFTSDTSNAITWVFPDLYNTYVLLNNTWNRISKLFSKMKISSDEFIYFQTNEIKLNIRAIWNLPVSTSGSILFPAFENLSNMIRFRNALTAATTDWFKLFDFAILNGVDAKKNFIHSLCAQSNFTVNTFEFLLGLATDVNESGFLKFIFPSDYLNGAALLSVINCANAAAQLGSSVDNIAKLTNPTPDVSDSALASSILKSKYDVTTWLSVIEPLSKQLRVKKRDALVNYILTSPETSLQTFRVTHKITGTNSLYACFLIDIEMDACMITSRIKQAISSLQLFIDRCLMNLEPEIVLSNDLTTQWNTWRKLYRVWEANRKIFLYPENWIEPELRDDKSPFFKELESELRQNEITEETAEDALRFYLEKLDTVANLEMAGIYPDKRTGIVHAIGRTQNIPHQYFYTKQTNMVWSAWEKIDLDIEGDHLLPIVWNNRLMLFWAIFSEKEENSGFTVPGTGDTMVPEPKSLLIKLAWSEYKNGKWSSKKVSKDEIVLNSILKLNPFLICLNSLIVGEKLYIRIFSDRKPDNNDDYIWNWDRQTFKFDGCHSAPVIVTSDPDLMWLEHIKHIHDIRVNGMFISEKASKDSFSVLDSGIYKVFEIGAHFSETTLLQNTPGNFQILPDHNEIEKVKPSVFFYNNERNNFYVQSKERFNKDLFDSASVLTGGVLMSRRVVAPFSASALDNNSTMFIGNTNAANLSAVHGDFSGIVPANFPDVPPVFIRKQYAFQTFYHPYVCDLIKTLNTSGINGLYKNLVLDTDGNFKDGIQNRIAKDIFIPNGAYNPTNAVQNPYPVEQVDFDYKGMYSIYNWELFFHIPLLIATRLSQNQKFDEARKWFHYIFDPTRTSSSATPTAERFWITNPFKVEIKKGILTIEDLISNASPDLDLQLKNWEQNPFKPHAVARLRISAYMRSTVMKYIDNLIAWGDQLFQRDTIETINEATLLYVLAANMLGEKRERVPARAIPEENSFLTIQDKLDSFSNAKVEIQSFFSLSDFSSTEDSDISVLMPQFCIPKNDLLLRYWDTVADRLFKIRHCLNIEGVFRQLPLFEPPIDPALLVRATAAGIDLNSVMNDMNVSLPNYRFQVMLQKANELCNDVKSLGGELLAALEKRDSEQLSLLRSSHELNILNAVRDIKISQVDEAKQNLDSLNNSKDVIQARRDYYGSREFRNTAEETYFKLTQSASLIEGALELNSILASISYLIPQVNIGPFIVGTQGGGMNFGNAAMATIEGGRSLASALKTGGELANIIGTFQRRQDDWKFQTQTAELELKQMDKQIIAAEIRLSIAEKDLENHDLQIEQSKEVDDYLKSKFTNEELYDYMVGQISSVYFQSYQLAFNTAKKVQKCFEYELGIDNTSFIQFGYWDSLKKGLLSGEKLQYDLRRLENAYLEQNTREYEITKHISIIMLDPLALIKLRSTGSCDFEIPEALYDMDHAGHYFRRIKSVSISLPCIAGPYTSVSAKLSLINSRFRKTANAGSGYAESQGNDERFIYNSGSIKSIAASNAQNDSGVFELNFRDDRYLPFEGTGAISSWSLELPSEVMQFNYNTISDVIIHINYTAKEGGSDLKDLVNASLVNRLALLKQQLTEEGLHIAINLKHDLSNEWNLLMNNGSVDLNIDKARLPYMAQTFNVKIENVIFLAQLKDNTATFSFTIDGVVLDFSIIDEWKLYKGINSAIKLDTKFALIIKQEQLNNLEELLVVVKYKLTV